MSFTLHMFWWSQSFFLFFVVVIRTALIDISYHIVVNYRLFRPVVYEMVILIPLHSRMDHVTSLNKLT
jgi:hypothetical protein